eukprot:scaffold47536_cov54-Phaeocystis_antarctica.AAC.1
MSGRGGRGAILSGRGRGGGNRGLRGRRQQAGGGRGGCNERGRGGRVRGGEDARGARRGAAWRGRVAGRMRQCRWTISGVCAAQLAAWRELARVGKTKPVKAGARTKLTASPPDFPCTFRIGPWLLKTLVDTESTLLTLPCQGRGTCSGGPRGPPGGVLRVVTCSSTLRIGVPCKFRPRRGSARRFRTMRTA